MKTYIPKLSEIEKKWYVVDVKNKVFGRAVSKVATILRGKGKVVEGTIGKVQSGKTEINRAESGQECGILFEGKPLIKDGDTLEAFTIEKIKRTLEDSSNSHTA